MAGDHYVPQTYLKHFAHKVGKQDRVCYMDPVLIDPGKIECEKIKDLCAEVGFYHLDAPGLTDKERKTVENFYDRRFETPWHGVWEKLVDSAVESVTIKNRIAIIGMACSLFFRNPSWLKYQRRRIEIRLNNEYISSKQAGNNFFDIGGEKFLLGDLTLEAFLKEYTDRAQLFLIEDGLVRGIKLLRRRIVSDAINVVKIDNSQHTFLVGDNPVIMWDPCLRWPADPDDPQNRLILPLDHKHALELVPGCRKEDHLKIFRRQVGWTEFTSYNIEQKDQAEKYLMGSQDGLTRFVQSVKDIEAKLEAYQKTGQQV
jgi:hypothetical protein